MNMNVTRRWKWGIVALVLIVPAMPSQGSGQQGGGIQVTGASLIWQRELSNAPDDLRVALEAVPMHVVTSQAGGIWALSLQLPDDFQMILEGILTPVTTASADQIWSRLMPGLPDSLWEILDHVPVGIVLGSADKNRTDRLRYPCEIVQDSTPPQIRDVRATEQGVITWTTNEPTIGRVRYGTTSGEYPNQVESPIYKTAHEVRLPRLVSGTRYYFIIQATDRCGNTAETPEQSFVANPNP
jgi:hypothetical protein